MICRIFRPKATARRSNARPTTLAAGASAPEDLVQGVVQRLKALGAVSVRSLDGIRETTKFPLPKGLKIE